MKDFGSEMPQPWGLALSGGGARGLMHIGLLQYLEEIGAKPSILSGSSMGSLVAAFYAAGHSPAQILEIIPKMQSLGNWNIFQAGFSSEGLLSAKLLENFLAKYLPKSFEELSMPIRVCASDLSSGEAHMMSEGPLYYALAASCCLPGLFSPVRVKGRVLADGGIVCNLPARVLKKEVNAVFGSSCNPAAELEIKGTVRVVERCLNLAIYQNTLADKQVCDWVLEPPQMVHYRVFDWKKAKEISHIGYNGAIALRNSLQTM